MNAAAGIDLPRTGWLALTVLCCVSAAVIAVVLHDWWRQ
jgi:hypothetical protein